MGAQEKQARRSRELLEKGLRRGDPRLALEGWQGADTEARTQLGPPLGALLEKTEQELARGKQTGPLLELARALTKSQDALDGLAAEARLELRWRLLWPCLRALEWRSAEALWRPLSEAVRARGPRVAAAVEAILDSRGRPPPALLEQALAALGTDAADPRLGVQPVQARVSVPAPSAPEELEPRLLAAFELCPFEHFARQAAQWLGAAPQERRAALWGLVAELAALRLLERSRQGGELQEPAELFGRALAAAPTPALEDRALSLFHLVSSTEPGSAGPLAWMETYATLAFAAARAPRHQGLICAAVARREAKGSARRPLLLLCERLLLLSPSPALLATAWLLWDELDPESPSAPAALQSALRQALPGEALRAWCRHEEWSRVQQFLETLTQGADLRLAIEAIDALWQDAGDELKHVLSRCIEDLFARVCLESGQRLDEPNGAALRRLASAARPLWERLGSRGLPYRSALLEIGLLLEEDWPKRRALVARHLGPSPSHDRRARTLVALGGKEERPLERWAVEEWISSCNEDPAALAEAALAAERTHLPCPVLHPLLLAFQRVDRRRRKNVGETVRRARQLVLKHGLEAKAPKPRTRKKAKARAKGKAPSQETFTFDQAEPAKRRSL